MDQAYQTQHSLIRRASDPRNHLAWEELVAQYKPFIHTILHQLGVDRNDIDDIGQQVFISLTNDLNRYDRNRAKFRTWLSSIVRNKANSYFRKQYARIDHKRVNPQNHTFNKFETPEIEKIIDREWANYVTNLALERVGQIFSGQAMTVFEMSLDGYSNAQIKVNTQLTISSIYTLKKRVKKRLYLEVRKLSSELDI